MDESDRAEQVIVHMIRPVRGRTPLVGLLGGAASGAVVGAIAGPAGLAFGAVFGGIVGAATGLIYDELLELHDRHEDSLDKAIGVSYGNLGMASPNAPPPRIGLYHAASLGLGGAADTDRDMALGPLPTIDIDSPGHA